MIEILNPNAVRLLNRDMQDLAADFANHGRLRKPFERIRDEVVIPSTGINFDVGGRPSWAPLSPATLLRRTGGGGILEDTGQMRKAATAKARFTIRDNTMVYGNWPARRWFGVVHNIAEYAANANIPHRPFTMFQPEDLDKIGSIMGDWMEEMVNRKIRRRYV